MKTNIIMAAYGNLEKTKISYESILKNTDLDFKLIIIDQNSPDGTTEWLKSIDGKDDRVMIEFFTENKGLVHARNFGIDNLDNDSDYVVFFDNDIVTTPKWASRMVDFMEKNPSVAIAGPASNFVGTPQLVKDLPKLELNQLEEIDKRGDIIYKRYPNFQIVPRNWSVVGFSMFIRKSVIDHIGKFDVNITGEWDDTDYCRRAESFGYKLAYVHYIYIHHWGHSSHSIPGHQYNGENQEFTKDYIKKKWGWV